MIIHRINRVNIRRNGNAGNENNDADKNDATNKNSSSSRSRGLSPLIRRRKRRRRKVKEVNESHAVVQDNDDDCSCSSNCSNMSATSRTSCATTASSSNDQEIAQDPSAPPRPVVKFDESSNQYYTATHQIKEAEREHIWYKREDFAYFRAICALTLSKVRHVDGSYGECDNYLGVELDYDDYSSSNDHDNEDNELCLRGLEHLYKNEYLHSRKLGTEKIAKVQEYQLRHKMMGITNLASAGDHHQLRIAHICSSHSQKSVNIALRAAYEDEMVVRNGGSSCTRSNRRSRSGSRSYSFLHYGLLVAFLLLAINAVLYPFAMNNAMKITFFTDSSSSSTATMTGGGSVAVINDAMASIMISFSKINNDISNVAEAVVEGTTDETFESNTDNNNNMSQGCVLTNSNEDDQNNNNCMVLLPPPPATPVLLTEQHAANIA